MTDQRCGPPGQERPGATQSTGPLQQSGIAKPANFHQVNAQSRLTDTRRLGRFAAGLADADLPVLPLLPRSKRPRFKGGYRRATCDLEWIDRHWWYHRDDNIGVRPPLAMVVLDVDPRNGGRAALARLVAEHGPLPQTWEARTGSAESICGSSSAS